MASLPIKLGGLGIRSVSLLAPSAYLSSAAGTRLLQDTILHQFSSTDDSQLAGILTAWSSLSSTEHPQGTAAFHQHNWDAKVCQAQLNSLLVRHENPIDRARLLAVSAPHSSDWLHALPISACGLRMDNEDIRVTVGLRLGARLCEPHLCSCGEQVDAKGLRSLVCRRSAGRVRRHQHLNDILCRALIKAGVPSVKEPTGLVRTDGKRPDGVTQIPWESGKCLAWDVTVTDTLAASNLPISSAAAGASAERAAEKKISKYSELAACYTFVPVAFETLGPVNESGADFINRIGRKSQASSGDLRACSFLWQRLSVTVQRYNAICLLGTFETLGDG